MLEERAERFAALYDSSRLRLIAYALRRTNSPEDAADVIAETFEIAWTKLESIPGEPLATPWLYVTCRHLIANLRRRTDRRSEVLDRLTQALSPAFTRHVGQSGPDRLEATAALSLLSEDDREILMLAGWEGLDTHQLALVLDCSPGAARVRLYHARRRLEELLDEPEVDRVPRTEIETITPDGRAVKDEMTSMEDWQ